MNKTKRDELNSNVFAFTATSVLVVSVVLSAAEWNVAWWRSRVQLLCVMSIPIILAAVHWHRWLMARRRDRHP